MKIAMYQLRNEKTEEKALEKAVGAVKKAAQEGADIIIYPELTLNEFFPQYEKINAEEKLVTLQSREIAAFCDVCGKNKIMAVPNFYLKTENGTYDASIIIDKTGKITGIQKMVHIAQAENFYEQDYYTPSDEGFKVFDTELGKIGIVVCFDRHYPESIRTEALMGADFIIIPTANTKAEPKELFKAEICVQAFQNCVPIFMCNRTGREDNMDFSGNCVAADCDGSIIFEADDKEGLFFVNIDLEKSKKAREKSNYLKLRKKEFYI